MKRIILFIASAVLALSFASCERVAPSDSQLKPDESLPDRTTTFALSSVLEKDPMNTAGVEVVDKLKFFSTYRMLLTYTDGEISDIEFQQELPFSTYSFDIPTGKQACYYDTSRVPFTIRLKSTDDVVATYSVGEFLVSFNLGCEEVSYEFHFKKVE